MFSRLSALESAYFRFLIPNMIVMVCGDRRSFVLLLGLMHIEVGGVIAGVYKKGDR